MNNENMLVVRPDLIDDVLLNPGIGFMTFQRFNGDDLNKGKTWTEGYPIEYQGYKGTLENMNHPSTTMAYFRIYWRFLEPEQGEYRWDLIDRALETARLRGQTLMLRVAPYGIEGDRDDVPVWYRNMVGAGRNWLSRNWKINHEDYRYAEYYCRLIRALGERYDGHPGLESVDLSIVGPWGEGEGSELLSEKNMETLVNAYTDSFKNSFLCMLLTDEKTNKYGLTKVNAGYRADCLGDMGDAWRHMLDIYPRRIIASGMKDAWIKAPITFEVCWVVQHWKDMGWNIDYIIDQSLKWHISSFNGKSSPIPAEWEPNINRWLKKMGYRLALRRFEYPVSVRPGEKLDFFSWWENSGVAPCYRKYPLALRIRNDKSSINLNTNADIRKWLPGDSLYDSGVIIPENAAGGTYELQIGLLGMYSKEPAVKLAMSGLQLDGWYSLGNIEIVC